MAVEHNDKPLVDFLLSKGANISATYSHSPLLTCIDGKANLDIMASLLEHRANPNERPDGNAYTIDFPLTRAIKHYPKAIPLLLNWGAVSNQVLKSLYNICDFVPSPLCVAIQNGNVELVNIFIDCGADLRKAERRVGSLGTPIKPMDLLSHNIVIMAPIINRFKQPETLENIAAISIRKCIKAPKLRNIKTLELDPYRTVDIAKPFIHVNSIF